MENKIKKENNTRKSSPIEYSGKVTVTIKRGNKIISRKTSSNNGTPLLFKTLCRCLCKDSDALNIMPFYIDAGNTESGTFKSGLVTPCVITKRVPLESTDGKFVAQFIATLLYSQLKDTNNELKTIALKNIDGDILATMTDDNTSILLTSSKYTALLQWEMSFDNSTESTVTNVDSSNSGTEVNS